MNLWSTSYSWLTPWLDSYCAINVKLLLLLTLYSWYTYPSLFLSTFPVETSPDADRIPNRVRTIGIKSNTLICIQKRAGNKAGSRGTRYGSQSWGMLNTIVLIHKVSNFTWMTSVPSARKKPDRPKRKGLACKSLCILKEYPTSYCRIHLSYHWSLW